MGSISPESYGRNVAEAEASVAQMNNAVDQMKNLEQALAEKRISNEQAQERVNQLVGSVATRIESMMALSKSNSQMIPALAKAASVLNRMIAITGGGDSQLLAFRDTMLAGIEQKSGELVPYGEAGLARIETAKMVVVAKTEAELMKFTGTSKDFFENPQFRELATRAHTNWIDINPEVTAILKGIISDYYKQNGITLAPNTKFKNITSRNGRPAFLADGQTISVTID